MYRFLLLFLLLFPALATAARFEVVVKDATSAPVADALVWFIQDHRVHHQKTDAHGKAVFTELEVGAIELVALKDGHALSGFTGFAVGDASTILVLPKAAPVNVRLINAKRDPLAGAALKSLLVAGPTFAHGRFAAPIEELYPYGLPLVRTNDDGRAVIPFAPADGHVRAVFSHPDYADSEPSYLVAEDRPHYIMLPEGVKLRGRVLHEGTAVENARVSVFRSTTQGDQELAETVTGSDGFFSVRLPEGECYAVAWHPDYASPPPLPGVVTSDMPEGVILELLDARTVRGTVVLPEGAPCPAARVQFRSGTNIYDETFTGVDGAFVLRVSQDAGEISIMPPQGYMLQKFGAIPVQFGGADSVALDPVRLVPLPELHGRVLHEGQPVANALVSSRDAALPVWTVTDQNGQFELRFSLMPSTPRVVFRAEHPLRFFRKDLEVDLEKRSLLKFELETFLPDDAPRPPRPGRNDLSTLVGRAAPEIACRRWWNGEPATLQSLQGKVVLLHFWAGFDTSPVARNQLSELRALQQALQGAEDVTIISMHDGSSEPAEVEGYLRELEVDFPVGLDTEHFDSFQAYQVHFLPQIVLLDKAGVVCYDQTDGRLLELIKVLLRKG